MPSLDTFISNWKVWLQIAITLIAVLYMFRSLARTPGRNAALGILALLGIYVLLKIADLNILARMLEQVLRVGVIILVVLFREEARQLLSLLGKRARYIFRNTTPEGTRTAARTVEEIATACERLIQSRHGALIVIENEDSLQALAETGYKLDAALSAPLLEAIFTATSPIHDGAVIVRDERIVAARAVLPLFRGDLTELQRAGTRHRAALGLASSTDASVIVVSEERGTVRVVRNGRFFPVGREHMRRELVSILTNEDDQTAEVVEQSKAGPFARALASMAVGVMATYEGVVNRMRNRKESSQKSED